MKICGITCAEDAAAAVAAGADALGFVLDPASARALPPPQAAALARSLPASVTACAVVRNPDAALLQSIGSSAAFQLVQFHGEEAPGLCGRAGGPWIKAVPMGDADTLAAYRRRYSGAAGFLLDSHAPGEPGGRGRTFAWTRPSAADPRPLILAGGLTADNVAGACRTVRPAAVDVSSGVEAAPGRKDAGKMRAFVAAVRHAC